MKLVHIVLLIGIGFLLFYIIYRLVAKKSGQTSLKAITFDPNFARRDDMKKFGIWLTLVAIKNDNSILNRINNATRILFIISHIDSPDYRGHQCYYVDSTYTDRKFYITCSNGRQPIQTLYTFEITDIKSGRYPLVSDSGPNDGMFVPGNSIGMLYNFARPRDIPQDVVSLYNEYLAQHPDFPDNL